MPDDRLEKARFVRVSKTGDLVFSLGGREMAVSVDDTLERAILEAKQVRSEMRQAPQPHQQSTLPISQIQSLIRAGADPARVAEKYHLSEMLVRRFSMAVETEKQYAIEQFLAVAAPKDSRVRTISELVERTLASAGIGMESVTWKSTRRGLEPWRIVAIFTSAGREIHAEWTWNMHDNSVMSLNNAARKLLGEQNPESATDSKLKRRFPNCPATPYAPRVSSAPCLLGRLLRLRFRPHGLPQSGPLSLPQVPCPQWIYPRPSHRPRPRLMALRPPVRSLRRPPDLFRHLPQDYSNRLPRHQSRALTMFRTRPYGVAPMHS